MIKPEKYSNYVQSKNELITKQENNISLNYFIQESDKIFKELKTEINYLSKIYNDSQLNKFNDIIIRLKNLFKNYSNNFNLLSLQIYEPYLRKYESELRHLNKIIFMYQLQKDTMDNKLKVLQKKNEEYQRLKKTTNVIVENGEFIFTDRKENEIIILRAENSKLKSVINQLELDKKNSDIKSQETISDLKLQIENLAKKVYKLEQKQIYDSSISNNNSSINININNNVNSSSKCIIKNNNIQNENDINDSNKKLKRLAGSALKKPPKNKQNIEYKNLTNISNKSINSPPKNVELKSHHHKTNSVNMNLHDKKKSEIIEKDFSNNFNNLNITKAPLQKCNNNQNYKKITNLIPNSKFPISNRTQNQQIISSISKIYMRGNKQDRTGNHSSFNIRPQSKEHY